MKDMLYRIVTVGTKGEVMIPSDMKTSVGFEPGARVAITQVETRIILEEVSEELVDQTRGMFTGKPSLCEELKRQCPSKDAW